jgi:hypothetical protein
MRRLYLTAAVGFGCALVLAACGSSNKPIPPLASNGHSIGIRYSDCMRTHGIPNFPDPSSNGSIQLSSSSGINPASPAFEAAQKDCHGDLPFGGQGRPGTSEQRKVQLLKLAQCMRQHGFTTFPDPTSAPPSSPPAGRGGIAFGGPGGFISVPASMTQSPGFKQAATACGFPGAGGAPKPISAG